MSLVVFKTVKGSQEERPAELDFTTFRDKVAVRKNIRRITVTEEDSEVELWEYEEAVMTEDEYAVYCTEETQAQIMLNQADIIATQQAQDMTLAEILLNTVK